MFGTRLNYPLPSLGDLRHKLILGMDIKNSDSVAGPLNAPIVTPITEAPVRGLTWFPDGQLSSYLLLPSEQFGAGGASSVRGYPERTISGDEGFYANFELYTPELNKYARWPAASLRALLFCRMSAPPCSHRLESNWGQSRIILNFDQFQKYSTLTPIYSILMT